MRAARSLPLTNELFFIVDNIINQLNENKSLLTFIAKNLSWGVFKHALTSPIRTMTSTSATFMMLCLLTLHIILFSLRS